MFIFFLTKRNFKDLICPDIHELAAQVTTTSKKQNNNPNCRVSRCGSLDETGYRVRSTKLVSLSRQRRAEKRFSELNHPRWRQFCPRSQNIFESWDGIVRNPKYFFIIPSHLEICTVLKFDMAVHLGAI
ncbi:hypothetical protein CISG_03670 [Coccidioides immitis RMSCC 3703]|uniref:Uncharacterized protein n=1 Tax=Coccidioides immitis RMSCC 3703 TaxID=454286 RepID=A0A0J8QQC8_COCIT|nr:hypothetical protein CISG_03670 [Coccidioides immitis RMSCC 3703]